MYFTFVVYCTYLQIIVTVCMSLCVGFDFNVSQFIYFHVCILIMMIPFGRVVSCWWHTSISSVHQKQAFSQIVMDDNKYRNRQVKWKKYARPDQLENRESFRFGWWRFQLHHFRSSFSYKFVYLTQYYAYHKLLLWLHAFLIYPIDGHLLCLFLCRLLWF